MEIRELTRQEKTTLNRAFDRWGVFEYLSDKPVMIAEHNGSRKVCLASPRLASLSLKLRPSYCGLVIGESKKSFTPSVAGADIFARHAKKNQYYVVVSDAAEQLVLYGRDIMGDSIVHASEDLGENELVIILNRNLDSIGLGRTRFSGSEIMQKGRVTITTTADAGLYLREEGQC